MKRTVRKIVRKRPVSKCSSKKIFNGRHKVFKLQTVDGVVSSRKYAILPLPPKVAERGLFFYVLNLLFLCVRKKHGLPCRALTLQDLARVQSHWGNRNYVTSILEKNKHVAACDGSPALHASRCCPDRISCLAWCEPLLLATFPKRDCLSLRKISCVH